MEGPLDFQELGVMHGLTGPLAGAGVSVLTISTYDTDVLVVRQETLARAIEALRAAGYVVDRSGLP